MKKQHAIVLLLVIIYFAFISLGLPDSVFGITWPSMRVDFGKPLELAGIITILLTVCAATSSVMSGRVLARFGTARVTFVSCLMTALGLLGYSVAPSFLWLIPLVPLLGFGAGAIDCGLNYYVAAHYSSRHMNWLHCCWGIGATIGPMIVTAVLAAGLGWRVGYRVLGSIQLVLSAILFLSLGLWAKTGNVSSGVGAEDVRTEEASEHATAGGLRRTVAVWTQISVYAAYAAAEFLMGVWAFSLLTKARGVDRTTAGVWVSFFYGSLTAGRFLTGIVVDRLGNRFMIRGGLSIAAIGAILVSARFFLPSLPDATALVGLVLLGGGLAPVYPCMTHETPRRFRPETARKMIGFQTGAACLGSALVPAAVGFIAARTSLEAVWMAEALFVGITLLLTSRLDAATRDGAI